MSGRLPTGAFALCYALGAERSDQAVADRFGVSRQAVNELARKEAALRSGRRGPGEIEYLGGDGPAPTAVMGEVFPC